MTYTQLSIHNTAILGSGFCHGGVEEFSITAYGDCYKGDFLQQAKSLMEAFSEAVKELCPDAVCVFKRYFLSDAANYASYVRELDDACCATSIVEQPPLNGSKIALWAYLQKGVSYRKNASGLYEANSGNFRHLWTASNINGAKDSYGQTRDIVQNYSRSLEAEGCNLELNCIRTWFFIHNIDEYYAGMVRGRNDEFDKHGLVAGNHFITSTGICGRTDHASRHVMMDAYAVAGIKREQIRFLQAPTHLNNTAEYGVRFERGTAVDYGDRRQVYISGTASIDNKGEVVHVGDIEKQTLRMIENVEVLLQEADCGFEDLSQMIVYLRDLGDYKTVDAIFTERFGNCPRIMTLAPVCRPTWLIEMECIAIKAQEREDFAKY